MNDQFHIGEILIDGIRSIENKRRRTVLFFVLPFILGLILSFFNIVSVGILAEKLLNALAIFTGFLFTLMVYVSDKANNARSKYIESIDHPEKRLSKRLSSFYHVLIKQISYTIVIASLIIIFLLVSDFNIPFEFKYSEVQYYLSKIYTSVVCSFLLHFLVFLALITSSMYAMFLHETSFEE
ncbi:hypothetical protein AWW67_09065 [Roseivirga seohaensis]|uniref:Uncharacterized protein n=1 Tax=Roseivirga seohaensis TaxID=1914963 RepID=A0A150XP09_9BACT|nr:hypothetical protein AWW67_09065 [Roseivirga seohaensis]